MRYGFAEDGGRPRRGGRSRPASTGCVPAVDARRASGRSTIPALGRLVGAQRARRRRGRARRRARASTRSSTGSPPAGPRRHRVELVRLRGATVLDDSYNASPGSMRAALDLLAGLPGRHVAVLGEMLELGEAHESGHLAVGAAAARRRTCSSSSARTRDGIVEGAAAAGLDRSPDPRRRRCRRARSTSCARASATATRSSSRRRAGSGSTAWSTPCGSSSASARSGSIASTGSPATPHSRGRATPTMTVELIQGLLLAFALVVILMPPYIRLLQAIGVRQADPRGGARDPLRQGGHAHDGRPAHRARRPRRSTSSCGRRGRTPRPSRRWRPSPASASWAPSTTTSTPGPGEGIRARQKLIWLTVVAFVAAYQIQQTYDITAIAVPFVGAVPDRPVAVHPLRGVRDRRRRPTA